jgi:putative ABC transport system permease protein
LPIHVFFKIFNRPILIGNPQEVLNIPREVMVSKTFAQKLRNIENVVGTTIYNEEMPDVLFTIGGVYEDFPKNSSFNADVLISMASYHKRSTENWIGNDRYWAYVKLAKGVDPLSLKDNIRKMQEKYQPIEEIEKEGTLLWYELDPFLKQHLQNNYYRNTVIIFTIVAFLLIFTGLLNYLLIVLYSVVSRSKEVGVRKCYGANSKNIYGLFLKEAALDLILSIILAICIILASNNIITTIVGVELKYLFTPISWWVLIGVCFIVFVISSLLPAQMFSKIPVSSAFRNYQESKKKWKKTLLFVQFLFSVFLLTLLSVIGSQYKKMINSDPGYEYENIVFFDIRGINEKSKLTYLMDKLSSNANVDMVEACESLPFEGSSGNNIYLPNSKKELFNVADQYAATKGFFKMMNFKILEGREPLSPKDVAVSESFVKKMQSFENWNDGAIGKSVFITEHSQYFDDVYTICGVYEDYLIGNTASADVRPSVRFFGELTTVIADDYSINMPYIFVKLNKLSGESIAEIENIIKESELGKEIDILSYKEEFNSQYDLFKNQKNTLLIGVIFTLVISLIGLIGYIKDETNRRRTEMAIRKINGATSKIIVELFVKEILGIYIIAAVIADAAAYYVSKMWLTLFANQIKLNIWYFVISNVILLIIITLIVIINSIRIANSNPVDSLKDN